MWCLREEGGHPSPKRKRDRDWLSSTIATPPKRQREEGVDGVVEGVVEGVMEGVEEGVVMDQGSTSSSPKLSTMPRRSLSVLPKYSVTPPSPTKPFPGCRANTVVSNCSVAEVAAKEPEESGKTKFDQKVNKPSVAILCNKYDCRSAKYLDISEKKTTSIPIETKLLPKSTSKTISRPRVKTKKWVRKKNGLFGWVTCVADGKSYNIGSRGSNFDGEEESKESAAGDDASTKDLEGTESC